MPSEAVSSAQEKAFCHHRAHLTPLRPPGRVSKTTRRPVASTPNLLRSPGKNFLSPPDDLSPRRQTLAATGGNFQKTPDAPVASTLFDANHGLSRRRAERVRRVRALASMRRVVGSISKVLPRARRGDRVGVHCGLWGGKCKKTGLLAFRAWQVKTHRCCIAIALLSRPPNHPS